MPTISVYLLTSSGGALPNIGLTEILIVLAIALMVIGPKKLPDLGRSAGRAIREFRRAGSTMQKELGLDEVADDVRGLRDQVQKAKDSIDVRKQLGLDDLGPLDLDGEQAAAAATAATATASVATTAPATVTAPTTALVADTAAGLPIVDVPAVATASERSDEGLGAPDATEPPAAAEAAAPTAAVPDSAAPSAAVPEAAAPTAAAPAPAPTVVAPARKKRAKKPGAAPSAIPEAAAPTEAAQAAAPSAAVLEAAAPTAAVPAPAKKKRAAKPRTPKAEAS